MINNLNNVRIKKQIISEVINTFLSEIRSVIKAPAYQGLEFKYIQYIHGVVPGVSWA